MFKKDDEGIIDLRGKGKKPAHDEDEPEFVISHVEEGLEEKGSAAEGDFVINRPGHEVAPVAHERPEIVRPATPVSHEPVEKVKVKLGKFLDMIVKNNNDEFFQEHSDQDIILNADFLADLASAGQGKKDKKWFLIFVGGIILGLVVAYFLFKK